MSARPTAFPVHLRTLHLGFIVALIMSLGLWITTAADAPGVDPPSPASQTTPSLHAATIGAASAATGAWDLNYHASVNRRGYRLANPLQEFSATLDRSGFLVHAGDSAWGLRLAALGRGDELAAVSAAEMHASANRVELRRGALTEWYANGPLGLEQGFTLAAPPAASDRTAPVVVILRQRGASTASADGTGRALYVPLAGDTDGLTYGGLVAFDARGVEMPARMRVDATGAVHIEVDDAGAIYPLTIDPLIQHTKLTAPTPTADDYMGSGVDMSDDTVVVGVPGYSNGQGAVFVFTRTVGSWQVSATPAAILTASDGASGDELGTSVAISGNRIIAGAPYENGNIGAAYVFERPGNDWSAATQTRLTAFDGGVDDFFGEAVDISGDIAVIGAYGYDLTTPTALTDAGAAYAFVYSTSWSTGTRLTSEAPEEFGSFGDSVAVDSSASNIIVVGAPFETPTAGVTSGGAAYAFPGNPYWTTDQEGIELRAATPAASDWLGWSVAVNGDTILAGAPQAGNIGATLVFTRPATGLPIDTELYEVATLLPSDGSSGDAFGTSVALSSGYAIVGSPSASGLISTTLSGAAYVYVRPTGSWTNATEAAKLIPSDGASTDNFGESVGLAGTSFVAGAPTSDFDQSTLGSGAAYVFTLDDLAVAKTASPGTVLPGGQVTYTIVYTNNGPNTVNGAVIADLLPAAVTTSTVTSAGSQITVTGTTRYNWQVAPLAPGAGGIITVTGVLSNPLAGGLITNTVTIGSDLPDATPADNTAAAGINVPLNADLAISKARTPARVTAGDTVTFTLTYSNTGPNNATGVVITDVIPVSITNSIVISSGPTLQQVPAVPDFAWAVQGALAPNATGVITVVGTLAGSLTAPETITNSAQIAAGLLDMVPGNNAGAAALDVCMDSLAVTSAADSGTGSLRWALAGICPDGTITIAPAAPLIVALTSGQLAIDRNVTIAGSGAATVTVDANSTSRIFSVGAGIRASISGVTLRRGSAGAGSGGGILVGSGATLTLTNAEIVSGTASTGGGIANLGVTAISNSVLRGNAAVTGGAIGNAVGTSLTVTNTSILENVASGGVLGGTGGGVSNVGAATFANVTFAGNRAGQGASIYQTQGSATLRHVTVANNTATIAGGGMYAVGGSASLANTLFAANGTGTGASVGGAGSYTNSGGNLCWPADTCNVTPAITYADPLLGALGTYLSTTPVLPLLPGSNAIDAGASGNCLASDQRGVTRTPSACDSGAFEARGFSVTLLSGNNQSTPAGNRVSLPLRVTVTGTAPDPISGGTVTFVGPATGASTNPVTATAAIAGNLAVITPTTNTTKGSYLVTATTRGATASASFTLSNTDSPITGLTAASSSPTILNTNTAFTATITTGTNVTYQWNFGDNSALASGANANHQYAAVGTYTAIVTATNNLGSASKSTTVTVRDVPISGLQAANNSPKAVGSAVAFTATVSGGTGVTYSWRFGDGATGSGRVAQHTYANAGTYTAIVTATNTSGSSAVPTVVTVQGLVTLTVQTVGDGTVSKAPDATQYVLGTVVRLTANPGAGQRFVGWSGAASGTANPLNVAMDNNKTIVATFEEIPIFTTFVYMPYVRNSEPTIPLYLPTIRSLSR